MGVYFDKLQDLILNLEASGFTRNNDVLYSVLALKVANKRFGPVCQVMMAGTGGAACDLDLNIVRARLELNKTQDGEAPMEHGLVAREDSDNSYLNCISVVLHDAF